MAGGSAIRGSRVGAGPMGEAERGDAAPRLYVSYYCANGHETRPRIRRGCHDPRDLGLSAMRFAGQSRLAESTAAAEDRAVQDTSGLRQERRTDKEAADILTEALQALRARLRARRSHLLMLGAAPARFGRAVEDRRAVPLQRLDQAARAYVHAPRRRRPAPALARHLSSAIFAAAALSDTADHEPDLARTVDHRQASG